MRVAACDVFNGRIGCLSGRALSSGLGAVGLQVPLRPETSLAE
jgi:hypothetical protein